jgi:N-formylglutamate deformylase
MNVVAVQAGTSPVILAFPHAGADVPGFVWENLNDHGRLLADTDWHIDRLYEGLLPAATTVRANFHRYVIDANRDPAGGSLYPGQNTTGLVPETDFDGEPIWQAGQQPATMEIAARVTQFHAPYHAALAAEIARVRQAQGVAVLYDCHSIRSRIPFLFPGRLPDFNLGTNDGRSCVLAVENAAAEVVRATPGFTSVINGRFKGGWTTRHYGRPEEGRHAIQMELAQSTYLASEAAPFAYDPAKAAAIRVRLRLILERIEAEATALAAPCQSASAYPVTA